MQYIAFDLHKRYMFAVAETKAGEVVCKGRVESPDLAVASFRFVMFDAAGLSLAASLSAAFTIRGKPPPAA